MQLEQFHPYILPSVPGMPEPAVDRALVDTAAQFCRDTLLWIEEIDPVLLQPGIDRYELYPEAGQAQILAVMSATLVQDGRNHELERLTVRQAQNAADRSGRPIAYSHFLADEIRIYPAQDARGELRCTVALQPQAGASSLPDFLYNEWRETLGAGTVARLLMSIGEAQRASIAEGIYEAGLSRAQAIRQAGRHRAPMRTRAIP